jgi:MYXO-CTERM domain-containing protein
MALGKSLLLTVASGVAIAPLVMAPSAFANDWPSLGFDEGRGRESAEKAGAPFSIAWNASPSPGAIVSSPTAVDGFIVVAGAKGGVSALNVVDGSTAWSKTAPGGIGSSPAIDHGRIFFPTTNGQIQALHLGTGEVAWSQAFGGHNYGSPAVVTDALGTSLVLAAGFPQQKIVRLSASTGATQWETARDAVADLVSSSPALGGGQVTFGMNGGRYQTLDLRTGATAWKSDVSGTVGMSAPLVVGATSYFLPGGPTAALYAADSTTGQVQAGWPVTVSDPSAPAAGSFGSSRHAVSSPATFGNLIVFVTRFEYDMNPPTWNALGIHTLREYLVAVDPRTMSVAWQQEIGHRDVPTTNDIPELGVSPTPVSFATASSPLVAVTSSIAPTLQVYDVGGKQAWAASLSAPTRSSPIFTNSLLIVATDMGVVHAFSSDVNHAPAAPTDGFSPADGEMVDDPVPTLKWAAASDPEGQTLSYEVRVLADGNDLYESPLAQLDVPASVTQVALTNLQLTGGATYRYAVRTRDADGAWSPWSPLHTFILAIPSTIKVGDQTFGSISDAIASLPATGGEIDLGRGAVRVKSPLQLPAGVTIAGMSPQDTIIDATGASSGVQLTVGGRTGVPALKNVTVMGAQVGVDVVDAPNAILRNVVVRDNEQAGVQVEASAGAEAINVTIAHNGTGASVSGKLSIHSSIVIQNATGLAQLDQGLVTSRYDNVFANTTANYQGVTPGTGDLSVPVTFRSNADFHLAGFQLTTDKGDPGDAYGLEPQPNGARVNMGAFGNTPTAEFSEPVAGWTAIAAPPTGVSSPAGGPTPVGAQGGSQQTGGGATTPPPGGGGTGCAVGGGAAASPAWLLAAVGAVLLARRRRR